MKKPKIDYYKEIIEILEDLKKSYPSYALGTHLSTALDEYGDLWGLPDKEVLFAFTKYRATLEYSVDPYKEDDPFINEIIEDGKNIKDISSLEDQ